MIDLLIPAIISCIVAFFVVFFMTPPLIKILEKRNFAVKDMNKKEDVMVVGSTEINENRKEVAKC